MVYSLPLPLLSLHLVQVSNRKECPGAPGWLSRWSMKLLTLELGFKPRAGSTWRLLKIFLFLFFSLKGAQGQSSINLNY